MSYPEIILRTAAVLVLLSLAGVMLASRRRDHTPWVGALFVAAIAAFVVTSASGASAWLGLWVYPLTALCVAKAAFFWLFARGLFGDDFRIQPKHAAIVGITMIYGVWQQIFFHAQSLAGLTSDWERVAAAGFELWVLILVLFALTEAHRGLSGDLVERRRRLRILFVAGVAAYLGAAVLIQGYNLGMQTRTPEPFVIANLALMFTAGLAAIWNLAQMRTASWLDPEPAGAKADELTPLECRILDSLGDALEKRHVYREEGLTIGSLAEQLGTREHVLRRVINQGLGHRNFNDFLHAYRIREACERLRRSEDVRLPVLSIALEVGYGSIGPFNRAFKARTGTTPTRFRRNGDSGEATH